MGSRRLPLQLQLITPGFLIRVLSAHGERDSAARGELRGDDRFARRARFDEIVQNTVRDRFIESVLVAVGREIKFKRLAFNTETVRHVIDLDPGEIRLGCNRTNGSEIVSFKMNPVISAWCRIWESLETRLCGRARNFGFAVSKQC